MNSQDPYESKNKDVLQSALQPLDTHQITTYLRFLNNRILCSVGRSLYLDKRKDKSYKLK